MVGAIALFVLAAISIICALFYWLMGSNPETSTKLGLLFSIVAAVCLSGALIIDGIRTYATKIINRLDWVVKQTGGPDHLTEAGSGAKDRNLDNLKRFRVSGLDQQTKLNAEIIVHANDNTEALRAGERRGMEVKRVEPLG